MLAKFGATPADIVDETLFVTDIMAAATVALEVRGEVYGPDFDVASTLVQIAALGTPDLMIEIKCTAGREGLPGVGVTTSTRIRPSGTCCDRDEIHDVVMRYAAGVDKRDLEMVEAASLPTSTRRRGGSPTATRSMTYIRGVAVFHTTMHMMGNQFVEVDGDTAAVDTYAMLTHHPTRPDGEPTSST